MLNGNQEDIVVYPIVSSKKKLSPLETDLISIINIGLSLSKPQVVLRKYLRKLSNKQFKIKDNIIDLSKGNLYVLGWGKVAAYMAEAIESILGVGMIKEGIVVSTSNECRLDKIKILKGSHPFPSKESIYAAKQIIKIAKKSKKNDYVLCLISGGGSSLICLPSQGISLNDKIETTKTMILSGIEVEEINKVRKHLSDIKGGKLAKLIYPANIINLIISDDIRDTINSIASGLTVPDQSTFADAFEILNKYDLTNKLPSNVVNYFKTNLQNAENETLKENSPIASQITNFIIFNNKTFLKILKRIGIRNGFKKVRIYPNILSSDIGQSMAKLCAFIDKTKNKGGNARFLILAGGEVEVKAIPKSRGGRAQHFAALMVSKVKKYKNSAFVSIASDGRDFIEGIAGAIINSKTMNTIVDNSINYKKYINDTNTFYLHEILGTLLFTINPTQTNVFDIYIFGQEKGEYLEEN